MPTFRFLGFQSGQTATMALVKGGNTAGPLTIQAWGQPVAGGGTGQLSLIEQSDGQFVAPTGVRLRAVAGPGFVVQSRPRTTDRWNTYDFAFHEIDYEWTITRPAGASASGERDATLNIPDVWKGRNKFRGPELSAVLDVPGGYTITCTARDWAGNVGTATWTRTVVDPNAAFPGAQTVCLSPSGNFAGAPAGAQQVTTWINAVIAVAELPGTQRGRILVRAGETVEYVTTSSGGDVNQQSSVPHNRLTSHNNPVAPLINLRVGTFGSGPKPVFRPAASERTANFFFHPAGGRGSIREACFYGIRFEGPWDETTETGFAPQCLNFQFHSTHLVVHQCEIGGYDTCIFAPGNNSAFLNTGSGAPSCTIVSESRITNWLNFGIFSSAGDPGQNEATLAVIHSEVARSPLALVGRPNDRRASNGHGPIRWESGHFTSYNAYYFSNAGWSQGAGPSNVTAQPCIRCITAASPTAQPSVSSGDYFSAITNTVCEGGNAVSFGATDGNGGTQHFPNNALVDGLLFIGSAQSSGQAILSTQGCTTVRNTAIIVPDTPNYGNPTGPLIEWGPGANWNDPAFNSRNIAQPQRWHNNTFVYLRTTPNNIIINTATGPVAVFSQPRVDIWQEKVIENNVTHIPNTTAPAPITADAPLVGTTIPGVVPRYVGPRRNFPWFNTSLTGTMPSVPPGGTIPFPYPPGTSQAHFAANPLGPGSILASGIGPGGSGRVWEALAGRIAVEFQPTQIVVRNISAETFVPNGSNVYSLSLDRRNELPGPDASRATPPDLPLLWTPATGSLAQGGGNLGARARVDLLLRVRGTPIWRGAIQPT